MNQKRIVRRVPSTLASALKAWRARMRFSQREAANWLRISKRTYQEWDMGRREPDHPELLYKIIELSKESDR